MSIEDLINVIALPYEKEGDLTFREITKSKILSLYSIFIKREYDKSRIINQSLIQTIKCVKLNKVSSNDCGDDILILETDSLPKPLVLIKNSPFLNVSTSLKNGNNVNIGFIRQEEIEYIKNRKFTSSFVYYYYDNDKIRILNSNSIETISIRSIFDNPILAKEFSKEQSVCCGDCQSVDSDCSNNNEVSNCFDKSNNFQIDNFISGLILSSFNDNNKQESNQ